MLYLEKAINSKHNFENGLKFELNLDWIKIALGFEFLAKFTPHLLHNEKQIQTQQFLVNEVYFDKTILVIENLWAIKVFCAIEWWKYGALVLG